MKKTISITLALLLAAGAALAQPGMGPRAPQPPKAPRAFCDMDCDHGSGGHGMRQGCGHGMRGQAGMRGMGPMELADELGLSDDQVDRLQDMRLEHRMQMIENRAGVQKAHLKVQSLMHDDNAPEQEVMGAIEELSRVQAEMKKTAYRHRQDMKNVLTADQQAKLEELRKDRRQDRQQWRQNRHQGQQGGQQFRDRRYRSSN